MEGYLKQVEKVFDSLEQEVHNAHPSWSKDQITAKVVRMFYLEEKL